MSAQQQQPVNIDPAKTINLQVSNGVALFLHRLVGQQPAAALAEAGVDGIYSALAQQIVQANKPEAVPALGAEAGGSSAGG